MNLQSDNVEYRITRTEVKQNDDDEDEEEDIISRLPDEILTHILSLLPDADAYRCRILSNRWNHLFFFLPSLCFKMPPSHDEQPVEVVNKFYNFVDKTFSIRNCDTTVIKRFFLSCTHDYDRNRVLDCLLIVLKSKHLQTLELRFPFDRVGFPFKNLRFTFSFDLLNTCINALVDLTLKSVDMVGLDETQLLFPCLKRLKLESIRFSDDKSPQNLISACPVLEELFLDRQKLHSQLQTSKISSPSLKRLGIQWCVFEEHGDFVIDAPKLEYFYIRKYGPKICSLTNPSSIVEAHMNIYNDSDIQLLTSISSARILTVSYDYLWGLHRNPLLNLPVLANLVKLIVDFDNIRAWDMLFILLNIMPNLQHITIVFGQLHLPYKEEWNPPREAPSCLRFMVKEILILEKDGVQVRDDVTLIRYLLRHSTVLEKLTLSSPSLDRETREKLLNIPRHSKSCRIEFV